MMEVHGFPPGFRFLPKPQECIHYLTYKVASEPMPFDGLFLDLNPYDLKHLPHIFSSVQQKGQLYTFTKLSRKGKIGCSNANRKVGNGTWHGDQTFPITNRKVGNGTWHGDQTFPITNEDDGTPIGMTHKFSYREKGSQYGQQFIMTEYSLPKGTSLQYDPFKDYVLCHIVKNSRCHNGKKVYKSKSTTTSHQVAAVFQQPLPNVAEAVAAEIPSVENPSTSSAHSSNVDKPTYIQPLDHYTPSLAPEDDHDYLFEICMMLDFETEIPSLDSSAYLCNIE